MTYIKKRKI